MKNDTQRRPAARNIHAQLLLGCIALLALATSGSLPAVPVSADGASVRSQPEQSDEGTAACPTCALIAADNGRMHLLAATYYSLRAGLHATLMLNNKGPLPLDVHAALYSLGGAQRAAPTLTVPGNSFREVDLRDWVGGDESFAEGSLQVSYSGADLMLGAQVYLLDERRSLAFEEKLSEPAVQFASARLESVWWLPSPRTEARLLVSNTSDAALSVTARVDGTAPRQFEPAVFALAPHETRVLDVLTDLVGARDGALNQAGGVSLTHTGAPGALLARMLIQEPAAGYSAWARFTDPAKGKSANYQGAGLRLGSVAGERLTPVVVARNAGASETIITGRIPYTLKDGSTGTLTLPALHLQPGAAGTFDLAAALASSRIEREAATAGLEFEYTGAPGEVLMAAQSVSQSLNHVFQVPLWDLEAQRSATGGYPWKIEGDTSTFIYIKNVTDRPQQYFLQLNYTGADGTIAGTYATGLKSVAAGQTVTLDLRELRDRQVPDAKGHTIPPAATRGQLHWSMRGAENLVLVGRAEQVDLARGLATSYACQNCCPDSFFAALSTDCGIPTFPQDTSQLIATERDVDCYGTTYEYDVGGWVFIDWLSFDASVATVDENGLAAGQAPGTAGLRAGWYATTWHFDLVHGYCKSSIANAAANAICDIAAPEVTFVDAKLVDTSRTAQFVINRATLDLPSSVCTGERFALKATFDLPAHSSSCCQSAASNYVNLQSDNKFEFAPSPIDGTIYDFFGDDHPPNVVIYLRRRANNAGTRKSLSITVGGVYESGQSYRGVGTVSLNCP